MTNPNPSTPTSAAISSDQSHVIEEALNQILHIATLPEITMKIIEVVENPESTAQDLNKIISNDPALCARVLKVVNSAFYGLPGQIGSINRAIVLLGLNAVKNIAIAASLSKLFKGGQISPDFNAMELWRHSTAVAAGSKLIADKMKLNLPDEAFLAGLIHDIGMVVEIQALRPKLLELLDYKNAKGTTLIKSEQAILGVTHQELGKALCERWKFPHSFACVTGYHHNPLELDPSRRTLTCVVHLADVLAAQGGFGYTGTVCSTEINPEILTVLNLTEAQVQEILESLPEAVELADQFLR